MTVNQTARRMKSRETSCSLADFPSWGARLWPFAGGACAGGGAPSSSFSSFAIFFFASSSSSAFFPARYRTDSLNSPPFGMSHKADAANTTTVTHHTIRTPSLASAYEVPSGPVATDLMPSAQTRGITAESVNAPDKVADAAPWYLPKSMDMLCMHSWTPAPIPRRKYPTQNNARDCDGETARRTMPTATMSMTPTTQTLVPYRSLARPVTILHACTDHAPHAKMTPSSFAWLGHSPSPPSDASRAHPSSRTPSAMNTALNDCHP